MQGQARNKQSTTFILLIRKSLLCNPGEIPRGGTRSCHFAVARRRGDLGKCEARLTVQHKASPRIFYENSREPDSAEEKRSEMTKKARGDSG